MKCFNKTFSTLKQCITVQANHLKILYTTVNFELQGKNPIKNVMMFLLEVGSLEEISAPEILTVYNLPTEPHFKRLELSL